ncbi:hypothetical protein BSL78_05155, partial [Apostichopus japonicus]
QDGWFLQTTNGGKETSVVTSEEVATYQDTDEEEKHLWENCTFVSAFNSSSDKLTKFASNFIMWGLSTTSDSNDHDISSFNNSHSEMDVNCTYPVNGKSLTVDDLATFLTSELLQITTDDIIIEVKDQPGIAADCCKGLLLIEMDDRLTKNKTFDNYCSQTKSDSCVLVPRPFPVATVTFYPPPKGLFDEPIEIVFSRQSSL